MTISQATSTQISGTLVVAENATAGNHNLTVTVNGETSQPVNFFVQVPASLVRYNYPPDAPNGEGPVTPVTNQTITDLARRVIATNACGVYQNYIFSLVDQNSTPLTFGIVVVNESFSNIKVPPGPTIFPNTVDLSHQGIIDIQGWYYTYPTCLGYNDNQAFTQNWSITIGSTVYPLTTTIAITRAVSTAF